MSYNLEVVFQCPSVELANFFVEQLPEATRDVFEENLEGINQKIIDAVRFWDYPEHIEVHSNNLLVYGSWNDTHMGLDNVNKALVGTGVQVMLACDVEGDSMLGDEDTEFPGIEGLYFSLQGDELRELDISGAMSELSEGDDDFVTDYQLFYHLVEQQFKWRVQFLLED